MMTKHFPNVTIPKNKLFMRCTGCDELEDAVRRAPNETQADICRAHQNEHHERVRLDRAKYARHVKKAHDHPDKYLSLAIDGMDSSKSMLPKPRRENHQTAGLEKMTFGLIGVVSHGRDNDRFAFTYPMDYPHDGNITCQVILDTLSIIKERDGSLPPVLYLQLDNTCRENKNRYVIGFLALLVNLGWFKKVRVVFVVLYVIMNVCYGI
jgi:hypothetical protein